MKIKKYIGAAAISAAMAIGPSTASADCEVVLCMAGLLQGAGIVQNCSGPVGEYFSIIRYDSDGDFDPGRTAAARLSKLKNCGSADGGWISAINDKFGTQLW